MTREECRALLSEGRYLYENREIEPSDWGDWADENAATLMDEIEALIVKADQHRDQLKQLESRLTRCPCGRLFARSCRECDE